MTDKKRLDFSRVGINERVSPYKYPSKDWYQHIIESATPGKNTALVNCVFQNPQMQSRFKMKLTTSTKKIGCRKILQIEKIYVYAYLPCTVENKERAIQCFQIAVCLGSRSVRTFLTPIGTINLNRNFCSRVNYVSLHKMSDMHFGYH